MKTDAQTSSELQRPSKPLPAAKSPELEKRRITKRPAEAFTFKDWAQI